MPNRQYSVPFASGPGSGVLTATVPMTSADILAPNSVTILPAPGAGKYYNVVNVAAEYVAGTIAYVDGGGAEILVAQGASNVALFPLTGPPNFMLITSSQVARNGIQVAINGIHLGVNLLGTIVNQPITAVVFSATTGNGSLKISVQYTVETA